MSKGVSMNSSPEQLPSLYVAVKKGDHNMVEHLLQRGANVESNKGLLPPLYHAIGRDYYSIAKLLLEYGANVEGIPNYPCPLFVAASAGRFDIVQLLLQNGANVGDNLIQNGPNKCWPLSGACEKGHYDIVELLLRKGAILGPMNPKDLSILLFVAIKMGHGKMITLLFQKGARLECSPRDLSTLLLAATRRGDEDIIKFLLQKGANPAGDPYLFETPLLAAIKGGEKEIIELLLHNGANLNGRHPTDQAWYLIAAIERGYCDILELLLRSGVISKCDIPCPYLLFCPAARGQLRKVKAVATFVAHLNKNLINDRLSAGDDTKEYFELFQHPHMFQHLFESCFCNPESIDVTNVPKQMCIGGWNDHYEDCENSYYGIDGYLHHLIKITVVNLYPFVKDVLNLTKFWEFVEMNLDICKNEFVSEVIQMKKLTLSDTNITFFDILVTDTCQVARYLRNSNVGQTLNSKDLNDRFPKYASILKCQVQKGEQRMLAMEKGIKVIYSLSILFKNLPREIIEIILNYLTLKELLILTNACPRTNL